MFDSKIAKYAGSMSWRFFVSGAFVMLIFIQFVPMGLSQEQLEASLFAQLALPVAQVVWIYCTMYLTLLWMSYSSAKESKNIESS